MKPTNAKSILASRREQTSQFETQELTFSLVSNVSVLLTVLLSCFLKPSRYLMHTWLVSRSIVLQRIRCCIKCVTENMHIEQDSIFLLHFFDVLCYFVPCLILLPLNTGFVIFLSVIMSNSAVQSRKSNP